MQWSVPIAVLMYDSGRSQPVVKRSAAIFTSVVRYQDLHIIACEGEHARIAYSLYTAFRYLQLTVLHVEVLMKAVKCLNKFFISDFSFIRLIAVHPLKSSLNNT